MTNIYPIPFNKDFYDDLTKNLSDKKVYDAVYKKYSFTKTVILVKILHPKRKFLLDELSDWLLANSLIEKLLEFHEVQKIKSNGSLGIFVTDKNEVAINFAKDLQDNLSDNFNISIGLCRGNVLLFDLQKEGWEIAGGPVNVASKIAEDSGVVNKILIEESVKLPKNIKGENFKFEISHIEISGVAI
ncbi:MAG TPA: hypothetical protein VG895_05055 [Patescibacteria group bacterium]|nr:hypothetical protein [Patescibacteria group bacterium]